MRKHCKDDSHPAGNCPHHATAGTQRAIGRYRVALALSTMAWLVGAPLISDVF